MSDFKVPPEQDLGFYERRKHDKWRPVEAPVMEVPVIDSHAHVHSMPDPAWELVRCAANGVPLVCEIADPSENPMDLVMDIVSMPAGVAQAAESDGDAEGASNSEPAQTMAEVILAVGVHPHHARLYDDAMEARLIEYLQHPAVHAVGEIGLDYFYFHSTREEQREAFRRQLAVAKRLDLPVMLHLRSGEGPEADAHGEALAILQEEGFPPAGTLLHCCSLPPEALQPWIDADCYIAYGGALTFGNSDAAREGAALVPADRLMLETDAPYMTPEPMRGTLCTPAHVIFTADRLAAVRGCFTAAQRQELLQQIYNNTCRYFKLAKQPEGLDPSG